MSDQIIFQARTDKGTVRLYANRVEIDKRSMLRTITTTVFLWNVAKMQYSGGKYLGLIAPNGSATSFFLRSKDDARTIHGLLSRMVGANPEITAR